MRSKRLELPRRIFEAGLPPVQVVDMRDELKAGQRGIFSRFLLKELESTLGRGEQAILFLNRRGTATYIFCRDCGYVLRCPNCETPLTYHVESQTSNVEDRRRRLSKFYFQLEVPSLRIRTRQAKYLSDPVAEGTFVNMAWEANGWKQK